MPPKESLDYRRTHNLLLMSRLLSSGSRSATGTGTSTNPSPFTLLLATLSQSPTPLLAEYIKRNSKSRTVFVSFATFSPPGAHRQAQKDGGRGKGVYVVSARKMPIEKLQQEVLAAAKGGDDGDALIIIDTLNPLSRKAPQSLAPFLMSLLGSGSKNSVIAVYNTDVPLPAHLPLSTTNIQQDIESYPDALTLLKYFATAIITLHCFGHVVDAKRRRDRALVAPVAFGLDEGIDGVLVGLGSNDPSGVVLELEYRRKSGRGVIEWFLLPLGGGGGGNGCEETLAHSILPGGVKENFILLEDHPLWKVVEVIADNNSAAGAVGEQGNDMVPTSTFELGLTQSQREARDQVVLPYFDAQRSGGIGSGGAILFTPDKEIDDFDDEEDEI